MSDRARRILFFAGALPLGALLVLACLRLPPSGRGGSSYGDVINGAAADERHAADAVTAINFDYRGFDTLGEEFILFTSVMGVVLLLRRSSNDDTGEDDDDKDGNRRAPPTSDAVRVLGLALVGLTVSFGLYIVTHGAVSPGGGFQGGVIIATAWLVLYLAGDARSYCRLAPPSLFEAVEALGAASYALGGAGALVAGAAYLANYVPLGPTPSTVRSGGTIALLSVAVGIEVSAGFVVLISTFVKEALAERRER
jgi:multicomponent Na+:H+ antiporter subunit B